MQRYRVARTGRNTLDHALVQIIRAAAHKIAVTATDYDPLVELIGDARFVLLGEASHGTHDFYQQRAQVPRRSIEEKKFTAVAVEADWPDAYRVNRYVRGTGAEMGRRRLLGVSR